MAGKGVELGVGTVAGEVREGHVTAFSKSLISVFSYISLAEIYINLVEIYINLAEIYSAKTTLAN